ncbi:hypothetical protein NECAME_10989 [Necator americanus]|uniref:Uncharacterized protein n=1 Tax=Necator americanus TaxID=51031 RepID=W2T8K7_NECAM|nr:hypothetical protein NECAME_10989 [Necator americanus]ETN77531.1 hypothetical protein NECAME_10989 [Necator americanus]
MRKKENVVFLSTRVGEKVNSISSIAKSLMCCPESSRTKEIQHGNFPSKTGTSEVLRSNQIFIRDSLKLFPITYVFPLQIQISLDSTSGSTPTLHSNPHTEIEWSPARVGSMDTVMHKALMHPQFAQRQVRCAFCRIHNIKEQVLLDVFFTSWQEVT